MPSIFLRATLLVVLLLVPLLVGRAPTKGRQPKNVAALIDRDIAGRLAKESLKAGVQADDAEFLRRAHLDLVGRIPTADRLTTFLADKSPTKRAKLIDDLLAQPEFGQHMARTWAKLIAAEEPPQRPIAEKWLTKEFNENRPWNEMVTTLLTATGKGPETAFVMSNAENKQPQPSKLAGSTARLFMGIQLQCAECHKHPFTDWKQEEFWAVAAFFANTRMQTKGMPVGIAEVAAPAKGKGKVQASGAAIVIPNTAGKGAGKVIKAKYLAGEEPKFEGDGPYRPTLAAWLTSPKNPFFARAMANRVWGQLFGRGLVNPIDDMHEGNVVSHPAVLQTLADEFVASGYDVKHLVRCICNTEAYQRTSRVAPSPDGREEDLYARMAVKVMSPDTLYDSLCVAMSVKDLKVAEAAGTSSGRGGSKGAAKEPPRERFVKAFSTQDPETTPTEFTHGIPQALRLLNESVFNAGAPVVDALVKKDPTPEKVITGLFLATLSREPRDSEMKRCLTYVTHKSRASQPSVGYAGVLWVLLNTQEFALVP